METKKIFNVFIGIGCFIIIFTLFFLPYSANGTVQTRTSGSGYGDSGTYNPLIGQGLFTVATSSSDYSNAYVTEVANAAIYGSDSSWNVQGLGIEPMADVMAATAYHNPPEDYTWQAFATAHADISIWHRIKDLGTAPEEAKLNIPILLNYRLETSSGDGLNNLSDASFVITSYYFSTHSETATNGQSLSGTLSFNTNVYDNINIGVSANVTAYWKIIGGELVGLSAQAVADPFLFIDPSWEYAQCFVVEEQSFLHPGEWVEVTRMWQNTAVPLPPSVWLLGSGLLGMVGWRRFRKN